MLYLCDTLGKSQMTHLFDWYSSGMTHFECLNNKNVSYCLPKNWYMSRFRRVTGSQQILTQHISCRINTYHDDNPAFKK